MKKRPSKIKVIIFIITFIILLLTLIISMFFSINNKTNKLIINIIIYTSLIGLIALTYFEYYINLSKKNKNIIKSLLVLFIGIFSLAMNEKIVSISEDITLLKYSIAFRKEESIDNSDVFIKLILDHLDKKNVTVSDNYTIDELISMYDFGDQNVLINITADNINKSINSLEFDLLNQENKKVNLNKLKKNVTIVGVLSSFIFSIIGDDKKNKI